MATAPTPGAARAAAANAASVTIRVDGRTHTLTFGELSALDASALRRVTGLSFRALMEAASTDPDLDVVAAIVWLSRRQAGEKHVKFETVAAEIGYDVDIVAIDDPATEDADSPEA